MGWGYANLGGGAGGAIKSMILVTAPEGTASATATYSGKTVKGKLKDGYWRLAGLDYGPGVSWDVTISNGKETASQKQPMEKLEIVYLEMSYWDGGLFDNGNQYENVTGGWVGVKYTTGDAKLGELKIDSNITIRAKANMRSQIRAVTANKIKLTNFNKLKIDLKSGIGFKFPRLFLVVSRYQGIPEPGQVGEVAKIDLSNKSPGIYTLDINELAGGYFIGFEIINYGDTIDYRGVTSHIWLE